MPHLVISTGGTEIDRRPLMRSGIVIGRSHEADIPIPDSLMSRRHAQFDLIGSNWFVTDLQSRNGTTLNGRAVFRAQLYEGDTLRTGRTTIRYHAGMIEPKKKNRHPNPTVRPETPTVDMLDDSHAPTTKGPTPLRLPTPQPRAVKPPSPTAPPDYTGSSGRSSVTPAGKAQSGH
jgi:pSer/pThr/pTyr-binding forkhead associated (FHA) protein